MVVMDELQNLHIISAITSAARNNNLPSKLSTSTELSSPILYKCFYIESSPIGLNTKKYMVLLIFQKMSSSAMFCLSMCDTVSFPTLLKKSLNLLASILRFVLNISIISY